MRAIIHIVIAMIVIPIYGIQVCPFIEALTPMQVIVPVILAFSAHALLRPSLRTVFVDHARPQVQANRAFILELALYMAVAVGLMVFNSLVHDFPPVSGLKVLVGVAGLGFFAAVDLALEHERVIHGRAEIEGWSLDEATAHFPLTRKVALFATVTVLVMMGIFMLLVIKDLDWLVEVGDTVSIEDGKISIIKEFLFVLAVVLPLTINAVYGFARNLRMIFNGQNAVLMLATAGDYTTRAPIATNDEFGVMAHHTNIMVERIKQRSDELALTRDVTILSLASLAETRDNETGAHILRTQRYVRALAERMQKMPKYAEYLCPETIDLLYKSAPLHDVGKVGIPDAILLKPGKHTDEEFEIMKGHAQMGADALKVSEDELGTNSFLRFAREIAVTHHEKWDGSGYPNGLKGEDIPLSGRLMAVADVYDALISKRVYKPAFPHDKAMQIIRDGSGVHFDPEIVSVLDAVEGEFVAIADAFGDQHTA